MATFLLHNPYNLGLEEAEREGELQETLSEAGVIWGEMWSLISR